ncbi:MAG: peptidylprolyl isomerase, partial [Phycisphaerales bacterium]
MNRVTALMIVTVLTIPGLAAEQRAEVEDPNCLIETSMGDIVVRLFAQAAPKTVANFVGLAEGTKEFTDPATQDKVKRPYYDGLIFHRVIKNFMIQGGCPEGTGRGNPGYRFEDEINATALGLDKEKAVTPEGRAHPWLMIQSQEDFNNTVLRPLYRALDITSNEERQARRQELEQRVRDLTLKDVYANLGYRYNNKLRSHPPKRGSLAMANAGPNTNGSQFF